MDEGEEVEREREREVEETGNIEETLEVERGRHGHKGVEIEREVDDRKTVEAG